MPAIIGTAILVAVAVIAWLHWFSTWVILDVEKRVPAPLPAPEPAHAVPPMVINVDMRGLTELVSAMNNHHHLPIVVFGFVFGMIAVVWIFVWGMVRITDNRRYTPPRSVSSPEIEHHPSERHRGELTVIENNPFSKWEK